MGIAKWQIAEKFNEKNQPIEGSFVRTVYASDGTTQVGPKDFLIMHTDPIVIEVWRIAKEGTRTAHQSMADFMSQMLDLVLYDYKGQPLPDHDALTFADEQAFWKMLE